MKKTPVSTIVCLDIIDFAKKKKSEQPAVKEQFNKFVDLAVVDIPKKSRTIVDTENGAVITCSGPTENTLEDALFIALTIRDEVINSNADNKSSLYLHIGINLGEASVDKNRHVVGHGLAEVQKIKSFGNPNQILVSNEYYDMASKLTLEIAQMFEKYDMHAYEDDIYAVRLLSGQAAEAETKVAEPIKPIAAEESKNAKLDHSDGGWRLYILPFMLALIMLFVLIKWVQHDKAMGEPESSIISDEAETVNIDVLPEPLPEILPEPEAEEDAQETMVKDKAKSGKKATTKAKPKMNKKPEASKTEVSEPADNQTVEQAAVETAVPAPKEKSTWNTIKDSVTTGAEDDKCSQGEIALNQCN